LNSQNNFIIIGSSGYRNLNPVHAPLLYNSAADN